MRPNRGAHPLPLLDHARVCLLDELAHSAEGFPAPVPEFGDSFRDELRCRPALARARLPFGDACLDQFADESRRQRRFRMEMKGGLGLAVGLELMGKGAQRRPAEREVRTPFRRCAESGDHYAS